MNGKINTETLKVCEVSISYRPKVKPSERPVIRNSQDIYRLLTDSRVFSPDTIEHREFFKAVLLNRAGRALGVMHISEGGISETVVDIRHIMQGAILANASSLVLAHNHPAGNCTPSREDDTITQRVKQACTLFSIKVLDHLIITPYAYYSYADEGRIV
ncbi:MAG: JAB domain-containing protein [Tannerella sp.]|nr:JAB domain-containing protein [Tannerella sp.]